MSIQFPPSGAYSPQVPSSPIEGEGEPVVLGDEDAAEAGTIGSVSRPAGEPVTEEAPPLPSANGINPATALESAMHAQGLAQHPPATEWDRCFNALSNRFRPYQKPFQRILVGAEGDAFLSVAQQVQRSGVKPDGLFTSLRQLQMRHIPVTQERIQELCRLHQTQTTLVQASKKETKPPLGLLGRVWSYIVSWFSGGYSAWKGTKRIQEQYHRQLEDLDNDAPSREQTVLRYQGTHDQFFRQGIQQDIQATADLSAIDPEADVLHLTNSAACFQRHGSCITQNAEHAQMLYLQQLAEQGDPPAHLEFSTAGMGMIHLSPVHHLDPAKILRLQEAAKEHPTERSLYVLPFVFEGYIGHIVNIAIDFNNKKVCFFDSKGKTIDQAQSSYPIELRYNLRKELARIGQACFGEGWSAEGNLLDNPVKFQHDTHNCGRWVAFHTEIMLKHHTWEESMEDMKAQVAQTDFIENFGESAGRRLVDPSNGFHTRLESLHPSLKVHRQ